jgi:FkbM family methyltransferase
MERTSMIARLISKAVPRSLKFRIRVMQEWLYGERELHLLPLLCDAKSLSIDVGANRGIYTYFLRKYSAGVLAIEANPAYVAMVENVFGKSVPVYQAAASERADRVTLWIPQDKMAQGMATVERENPVSAGACTSIEVPCITLDSIALNQIGFVKIDVEGHELSVLKGATKLLARDAPTLLIEVEERHRENAIASVRDFLENYNYMGFFLLDGKLQPIRRFDAAAYQNPDNLSQRGGKEHRLPYINNLLFVSRDKYAKLRASLPIAQDAEEGMNRKSGFQEAGPLKPEDLRVGR